MGQAQPLEPAVLHAATYCVAQPIYNDATIYPPGVYTG
jgi:hypothetical protein